ncbi:MAG TPA: hypothetical protein VLB82_02895 [Thermodesulfobacteriota bacterium]|nr:hypothetical protein [Thermodesulfobacteriota bacterium]
MRDYVHMHKGEKLDVLIDNKIEHCDRYGYIYREYEPDIWLGRMCRDSYIDTIREHSAVKEENFWVLTHGHVFIFNYNENTLNPDLPKTVEEYSKRNE